MTTPTHDDRHWHPAFATCSDGIALTREGEFVRVNEAYAELHGFEPDALRGTSWRDRYDEAACARLDRAIAETVDEGGRWTGQVAARRRDGATFACDVAVCRSGDRTLAWTVTPTTADTTGAEQPTTTARSYRTVAENFPNGAIALFDEDLRYTVVEGGIFDQIDLDASDLEGHQLSAVHSEAFLEAHLEHYRAAFAGEARDFEFTFGDRVFQAHIRPVRDANGTIVGGLSMTQDVTERHEAQRELERQRHELMTLTRVNELVMETIYELIESTSKATLYDTVCERLADSEVFRGVWIGEPAVGGAGIECRAAAGTAAGELPAVDGPVADTCIGREAADRALETGAVQVDRAAANSRPDDTPAEAVASTACVPISYRETTYGVVIISSAQADAFSIRVQTGLAVLGKIIGLAIRALKHRNLLFADRTTELELRITDTDSVPVLLSTRHGCHLSLDAHTVRDDRWYLYVTVDAAATESILATAADHASIDAQRVIGVDGDEARLELVTTHSPLLGRLADMGATVTSFTAEDGVGRVVLELAEDADVGAHLQQLQTGPFTVNLLAQRTRDRSPAAASLPDGLLGDLTDRQREAVRIAYRAGYFEWPRASTAEEIATRLDITRPTFQAHLRKAQEQLLAALLE